MTFFFVKLRFFWFEWSLKKKETIQMAHLKSKMAAFFFFYLSILLSALTIGKIFNVAISEFLWESIFRHLSFLGTIISTLSIGLSILLFFQLKKRFFPNWRSYIKVDFEKYVNNEKQLLRRDRVFLLIFLISFLVSPIFVIVYLGIRAFG
jgi:hypothetical protein